MAQLAQQPGLKPTVNVGSVSNEVRNAPLDPSGTWRSPPALSDLPTLLDLKSSLKFAHSNIELLRNQLRANAEFQKHQASSINSGKKNLIITGVNEVPNENTSTLIIRLYNFFSQYVDTLERDDFDTA